MISFNIFVVLTLFTLSVVVFNQLSLGRQLRRLTKSVQTARQGLVAARQRVQERPTIRNRELMRLGRMIEDSDNPAIKRFLENRNLAGVSRD